jgi:hypothetical protein
MVSEVIKMRGGGEYINIHVHMKKVFEILPSLRNQETPYV